MLLPGIRGVSATAGVSADPAELAARTPAAQAGQVLADRAVASTTRQSAELASATREALDSALESAREKARLAQASLEFSVDDESGRTVVKVLDSQTNEVIRQIPSEEMLAIARNLDRIEGLLLRQTA